MAWLAETNGEIRPNTALNSGARDSPLAAALRYLPIDAVPIKKTLTGRNDTLADGHQRFPNGVRGSNRFGARCSSVGLLPTLCPIQNPW